MSLPVRSILMALAGTALIAVPSNGRAQISVLSSTVEEKEAAKGETYAGRIVISNPTTSPQAVRIYQTDYGFKADGTSSFGDPGSTPRSNASWVAPQTQRVTIPPRSEVTVPYTVKIPQSDSLKGTYWSAIMVEAAETAPGAATGRGAQAQVGIGSVIRYAIQVATHIGPSGTRTVKFENPSAGHDSTGSATLDFDVMTTGERAVRPKLSAEVYDAQGVVKAKGKQDRGLVYPASSFRQHFDFGKLPPGTYKVVIFADTGAEQVFASQFTIVF
jgi:hypothetical protein